MVSNYFLSLALRHDCWYSFKDRKRGKINNRYNQAPHLTQDTNKKVTTSQFDIINENHEVSPFPAGGHKASINRRARKHNKKQDRNNINDPTSPLFQMWIKTHRCLVCTKDP